MSDGIARMGEIVFSDAETPVLRALGLGSCIGLCAYDPSIRLACIAHIMLPEARDKNTDSKPKYADTAVPDLMNQMTARGAVKYRIRFAIAGGAQLFAFEGAESRLNVGRRNAEAVKLLLQSSKLNLVGEDLGGKNGRTVTLDAETGEVYVKQVGGADRLLARLVH